MVYVEFPTDLIVNVHWPKKKKPPDHGTHPCIVEDTPFSGAFGINWNSGFSPVAFIRGVDLSADFVPYGIPIQGTLTFGGGEIDAKVFMPGVGPPFVLDRPSYTHYGCGFDIGFSTDESITYSTVASFSIDINEGDSGPFDILSVDFGPVPAGTDLYVGVQVHAGDRQIRIMNLLLPTFTGGAGYLNVLAHAELICTGPAPSEDEPQLTRVVL